MPYKNLVLPDQTLHPFFYTSFAQTADGKVYVNKKGYWPIGSKTDYDTFTYLRSFADTIIDGKNTAIRFGKYTIDTIHKAEFRKLQEANGKSNLPEYIILTQHPDEALSQALKNSYNYTATIFQNGIKELMTHLQQKKATYVFVDGGPHVIASFLKEKLLNEIFVTIAPRIFGNADNLAITMVEGMLMEPDEINLKLVSVEQEKNELYLRYSIHYL